MCLYSGHVGWRRVGGVWTQKETYTLSHERNFEVTELPNCLGAQNNEGIFKVLFSRRGYFFSTNFMIDFTIAWLINIHLNHKTLHGFQKGVAQLFQIRS